MKAIAFVGAIVALSVGFSACERSSPVAEPTTDKRGDLSIGVVLPLTGHLAATGQLMQQGFDLALDEINADPRRPTFKFIVEDDSSTATGAVPVILMQKHELGLSVPFVVSSLTDREVQTAGVAAEGAITFTGWLPTDTTPGNQAFVENYRARFGTEPTAFAAFSYASVLILTWAVEKAPSTDSVSIREALADLRDLDTVLGPFSFDANGDAMYEPKVLIVKEGTLQAFE